MLPGPSFTGTHLQRSNTFLECHFQAQTHIDQQIQHLLSIYAIFVDFNVGDIVTNFCCVLSPGIDLFLTPLLKKLQIQKSEI